jgi:hypothetical protein
MISLLVQEQVMAEQRKMLMSNMTANKTPKAIHNHINQSESPGPNPTPVQYTADAVNRVDFGKKKADNE